MCKVQSMLRGLPHSPCRMVITVITITSMRRTRGSSCQASELTDALC